MLRSGEKFAEDGKGFEFCPQRCMEGKIIYDLAEEAVAHLAAAFDLLELGQRGGHYLVQQQGFFRLEAECFGVIVGKFPCCKIEVWTGF